MTIREQNPQTPQGPISGLGVINWAILNEKKDAAIEFDSLLSLDVRVGGQTVSTPVEQGSFADYNKTQSPVEIRAALGLSGRVTELDQTLENIKALQKGLELVSLVTPSAFYDSLTIESYSYRLERERGVLEVELVLIEVRQVETQTGTTNYTKPKVKNPTSTSTQKTGKVQPKESSPEEKEKITGIIHGKTGRII